ncbi:alginate export family protein [Chitinophaga sp.]|uniref:alginate export family protein n=1 Tax=Chitinophaga sp. TaxID=1869181 RepID=UPI0026074588|nr:alginate export family protein [uncultured Chitinophaga sp.]
MNKLTILCCCALLLAGIPSRGQQTDVSADLRFRYEYRHGYGAPFHDTLKAASFMTQRTRIVIDHTSSKLKLRIAPQNVRTWGDVATGARTDANFQMHEAWAELLFAKNWSVKAGRQELNYDDARILGNVDWTMQARSHDVLLFKYTPSKAQALHAGAAVSALRESNAREPYTIPQQYKHLQFAWYHRQGEHFSLSLLALNQALPYLVSQKEKLAWNQTFGTRATYAREGWNTGVSLYAQTGKLNGNSLFAWNAAGNVSYRLESGWAPGLGMEFLSGKAGNDRDAGFKSFTPWFGTNHKFNGFMDYFFVGNHANSVGLTDLYAHLAYEKPRFKARITPHYFATAAGLYRNGQKLDNYLGTEIDCTFGYRVMESVWLNGGYSQMLATESMEALKGGSRHANNWFFLELQVNPKLFSFKTTTGK